MEKPGRQDAPDGHGEGVTKNSNTCRETEASLYTKRKQALKSHVGVLRRFLP